MYMIFFPDTLILIILTYQVHMVRLRHPSNLLRKVDSQFLHLEMENLFYYDKLCILFCNLFNNQGFFPYTHVHTHEIWVRYYFDKQKKKKTKEISLY